MIKTRVRKIMRDVWARKGRTALVSIAIFIGVWGTIALFSMSDILVSQLREDIQEDELAMLDTFVTVNAGTELDDEAYLQGLSELEGVTSVLGGVQQAPASFVQEAPEEGEDVDYEDAFLFAYTSPLDSLPIEPLRVVEGELPGEGEIAVEQRMAEEFGIAVGDTLYFRILTVNEDGTPRAPEPRTVSAILFHPYSQQPDISLYGSLEDARYIGGLTGLNAFQARFTDFEFAEASGADAFTDYLAEQTPYIPVFSLTEDPEQNQLLTSVQTLTATLQSLAMLALIVSGFLVINVISSIVVEQKRQIGVMKSMGASTADNFFMYSGIALAYGVIAVIPGALLGVPTGAIAAQLLGPELNTVIDGFQISPASVVVGVMIGLLVPVLSSVIPVFFGTRVKILDAMTDLGIDVNYGTGPIARLIGFLPVPITVRQGLSNVSIKKFRLLFTVITLTVAAGAFMGIFGLFDTLTTGINNFLDTFVVEVGVFPNEGRDPELVRTLLRENFDEIENIEPGFQWQVEFQGFEAPATAGGPPGILAYGFDYESETPAFVVNVDEGDGLTSDNYEEGIILSSTLATAMDVGLGDRVVMEVPGNSAELQIVGISDFPINQVWLDWRTLALITGYTISEGGEALPADPYSTTLTLNEATVNVLATAPESQIVGFIASGLVEGEMFSAENPGVVVSQTFAEAGGYALGDTLTVGGEAESAEYPIVGILQLPDAAAQDGQPLPDIALAYDEAVRLQGLAAAGGTQIPIPQGYFLTTTLDDPSARELDDLSDDLNEFMLNNGIPAQTFNFVALVDQITSGFLVFQVILQAVALLIALVGALGLLTTLSMSVFERQKEIGVMRSIGAGSTTIATQFLTEGLVVGVIAWLLGLPLAYGIQAFLLTVTEFDETFPLEFSIPGAILGLIGMLVITTLASLWPSLSAARKTVSDILRYQ